MISKEVEVYGKTTGINTVGVLEAAHVYTEGKTILVDLSKLSLSGSVQVEVFNLLGQALYSSEMTNEELSINMKNESSYYLVVLTNEANQKVFKVID